ncbi:capping complex subunit for YIEGIA [Pseudalkalibacillus caeni]|uniref:Uncharacterized protein n=1 Tax=Exobacillus caeni TaxID=2574798 RepID=A0A5R9F627_9BACL|nr:hypothetical protein [Pseudalkalibacillus caeni]TLS35934.1 hypothetical protein FCL54_18240 [Pseudalkalibacillus caeni]
MKLEKLILATITTDASRVQSGQNVFVCNTTEEGDAVAAELEAILDGIAHKLSNDVYIIVKH